MIRKKRFTLVLVIALAVVVAFAFGACGGGEQPAEEPPADTPTEEPPVETETESDDVEPAAVKVTIAMLPKFKGENYFDAVKVGAEEAVAELVGEGADVELLYDGPPQNDATNQNQVNILEGWIAQGVNAILVSPNDPTAIAPTLKKAMEGGIKVLTFDADADPDARDLFINQGSYDAIGSGMVKAVASKLTEKGYGPDKTANLGIVSSAKTDANQNAWLDAIKALIATDEYSWLKIANEETDVYYPGPDETETQKQSGTLISRMGDGADQIQAAIGLTSMATPALGAQYESAASKPDATKVTMTGLATPNALKDYIKNDANPLDTGVLWNCMDLGYLSVEAAYQYASGTITPESTTMTTSRLGEREIADKVILLGDALIFDKANIDEFNY
ncbi:MAG: autoinducer 2 ABC transporter substrate-binding protein [Clostridiales Family XIII bacterium]|jgi:ABC-type sugar transport system substrate-binding protein|nr:autoinducer 2 ABC transporter substrate-binding protein [Clostridiales Family XIII bacterium]